MQPHITPVSSVLSSMHLPQPNHYHWTFVCISMNGRQTQILVSLQSAHTNAVLIGSSPSGTRVAVQSTHSLVSLPATAIHPSQLSGCCIRLTCKNAGHQESIRPQAHLSFFQARQASEKTRAAQRDVKPEQMLRSPW